MSLEFDYTYTCDACGEVMGTGEESHCASCYDGLMDERNQLKGALEENKELIKKRDSLEQDNIQLMLKVELLAGEVHNWKTGFYQYKK